MALPARRHVNMHVQLSILHFLIKPVADSYSLNVMAKCYDSTLTLFLGHPRLKINSHDQQEVIKCEAPPIIKCEAPPINILAGDQYKQNTSYALLVTGVVHLWYSPSPFQIFQCCGGSKQVSSCLLLQSLESQALVGMEPKLLLYCLGTTPSLATRQFYKFLLTRNNGVLIFIVSCAGLRQACLITSQSVPIMQWR